MAFVYILYSKSIDRFYVGSCFDLDSRLREHNTKKYPNSYTAKTDDWEIFFSIDGLEFQQARRIEKHIKNMKSRIYYFRLLNNQDVVEKLKLSFQ